MFSMLEAAKEVGTSKASIHRAIKSGKLSARRRDDGSYEIDPAELFRVYPVPSRRVTDRPEQGETPSETALQVEVRMLRELLDQMRHERDELRGDRDAWRGQAERLALTDARRPGVLARLLRRSA